MMLQRFVSAAAVASILIALAAVALTVSPVPELEDRHLLTSVWCMVPAAWGLWAVLVPGSWFPERLPLWGGILGLVAGTLVVLVLDVPARFIGETLPIWIQGAYILLAAGAYYLLWFLVRRTHRALIASSTVA
jgi:hypothetical protein